MPIRRAPHRPNAWQLQELGRRFPPHYLHQSWQDFLVTQWVCDAKDSVDPLDDGVIRTFPSGRMRRRSLASNPELEQHELRAVG
jgi:hypothetical protein